MKTIACSFRLVLGVFLLIGFLNQYTEAAMSISYQSRFGQLPSRGDGELYYPSGVAVDDSNGEVFVADSLNQWVQRFTSNGVFLNKWPFAGGIGLTVDPVDHTVYIGGIDHRMYKYDALGNLLAAWGGRGSAPGQFIRPRDVAVHPVTRNVFVLDSDNQRVQEFTPDGTLVQAWQPDPALFRPYGIAIDPTGTYVWVANTGSLSNNIRKYDLNGNLLLSFGSVGSAPQQFRWPRGMAVDASGNIYVADTDMERVQKFDANGKFLQVFQGPENDIDGPAHPRAVAVNRTTGDIYTAASYSNRIDHFDSTGAFIAYWGHHDRDGLFLSNPKGMTVDPLNKVLYVADTMAHLIKKFTYDGTFLGQYNKWPLVNRDDSALAFPAAISIDAQGNYWALNEGIIYPDDPSWGSANFVRQFDNNGTFLSGFGHPDFNAEMGGIVVNPTAQEIYVSVTRKHKIIRFDFSGNVLSEWGSKGSGPGQFVSPAGLALNVADGFLYVVDGGNQRIQKFSLDGAFLSDFGSAGSGPGQFGFNEYSSLAVDPYGNLYVADTNNHRIQVFNSAGGYLQAFGSSGFGAGKFASPKAVAYDDGNLFVLETSGKEVEVYNVTHSSRDVVWLDDAVPAGGTTVGTWNFSSTGPTKYAGNVAHHSAGRNSVHQHYFYDADERLTVNSGDVLFSYVYLDPTDPPSEIMLQWRTDGDWGHRAYWGGNNINWGTDGTASRWYVGPLPAAGGWVRLEVPASVVGLEGRVLNGMAFTVDRGKATWDYAGKSESISPLAPPPPPPPPSTSDTVWLDDNIPTGASTAGVWDFVASDPAPVSGTLAHRSILSNSVHQHYFYNASERLVVNAGDTLFTYVYLDPLNPPREIMLQWREGGSWDHRAYWGANTIDWGTNGTDSRRYVGALPAAGGWVRLEVPASSVGLEGRTLNGMAFTLDSGYATWDYAGSY